MSEEQKNEEQQAITLELRKIYVENLSVEVPEGAEVFNKEIDPEFTIDVSHTVNDLKEKNYYGVKIRITATCRNKLDEKVVYLVELDQGGIFEISGLPEEHLEHAKHVYCTTVLYPYAREAISSSITKAGFPAIYLNPVDFEAAFREKSQNNEN